MELLKTLAALLLLALTSTPLISGQPAASGPTPAPLNITGILDKAGNYHSFILLLTNTRVDQQLNAQINNSFNGLTIFCPTDNAFQSLKAGLINGLTNEQQVQLVLFHVIPRYYTTQMFLTASNPLNTQSPYTLNVSTSNNQVNISTGLVSTPIANDIYTTFPLALYSVEKVLLPAAMFEAKPPTSAPPPAPAKPTTTKGSPSDSSTGAEGPTGNYGVGLKVGWCNLVVGVLGFVVMSLGGSILS